MGDKIKVVAKDGTGALLRVLPFVTSPADKLLKSSVLAKSRNREHTTSGFFVSLWNNE